MPEPGFLADMNISPITIDQLKRMKWNIVRVSEIMDKSSKDIEILKYAEKQNKVVITFDLDFSILLALGGHKKPSVINLRIKNAKPDYVTRRLIDIVPNIEIELIEGAVVSVDETSVRYRSLPIKVL